MAVKTSLQPFWAKGPCVSASLLFLLDTCHPDLSREYLPPPDCGPSQSGQNAVTELTMKGKKKACLLCSNLHNPIEPCYLYN